MTSSPWARMKAETKLRMVTCLRVAGHVTHQCSSGALVWPRTSPNTSAHPLSQRCPSPAWLVPVEWTAVLIKTSLVGGEPPVVPMLVVLGCVCVWGGAGHPLPARGEAAPPPPAGHLLQGIPAAEDGDLLVDAVDFVQAGVDPAADLQQVVLADLLLLGLAGLHEGLEGGQPVLLLLLLLVPVCGGERRWGLQGVGGGGGLAGIPPPSSLLPPAPPRPADLWILACLAAAMARREGCGGGGCWGWGWGWRSCLGLGGGAGARP